MKFIIVIIIIIIFFLRIVPNGPITAGTTFTPSSYTIHLSQLPNQDPFWPFLLVSLGNATLMMRQFLFCLSTKAMSGRLRSSSLSVFIVKSQSILKFSLFATFLGICSYHFTLPSNLCCLHNNVPDTLSCLCLYYFRANFGLSDVYEIFEV